MDIFKSSNLFPHIQNGQAHMPVRSLGQLLQLQCTNPNETISLFSELFSSFRRCKQGFIWYDIYVRKHRMTKFYRELQGVRNVWLTHQSKSSINCLYLQIQNKSKNKLSSISNKLNFFFISREEIALSSSLVYTLQIVLSGLHKFNALSYFQKHCQSLILSMQLTRTRAEWDQTLCGLQNI